MRTVSCASASYTNIVADKIKMGLLDEFNKRYPKADKIKMELLGEFNK